MVGRIWLLCRHILTKTQENYLHLIKIMKYLPGNSEAYLIPEDLFEFFPEDLEVHVESLVESKTDNSTVNSVVTVDDFLDLGEPVKRKIENEEKVHFKKMKVEEETKSKGVEKKAEESKKDVLSDIHSLEHLKEFLKQETEARKVSKKTCFTKTLSQEEWKAVKKEVISK